MEKIIAACGLDCAQCPAHIASRTNDQALRQKTAEAWSAAFGVTFLAEMVNCHGCHATDGVQIGHCVECLIRACALGKGYRSCAVCASLGDCASTADLHRQCPEALANLRGNHG